MNKYFFVSNDIIKRICIIIFVFMLFGFYSAPLLLGFIFSLYLVLFRRRTLRISDLRLAEPDLFLSPVSGRFIQTIVLEDSKLLEFKINCYNSYGIYLPFNGEIIDSQDANLQFQNKMGEKFYLRGRGYFFINKVKFFVSAGDKGTLGGILGYFPFGGKVYLEIPSHCDVIIKPGERVFSSQTIIVKKKDIL